MIPPPPRRGYGASLAALRRRWPAHVVRLADYDNPICGAPRLPGSAHRVLVQAAERAAREGQEFCPDCLMLWPARYIEWQHEMLRRGAAIDPTTTPQENP